MRSSPRTQIPERRVAERAAWSSSSPKPMKNLVTLLDQAATIFIIVCCYCAQSVNGQGCPHSVPGSFPAAAFSSATAASLRTETFFTNVVVLATRSLPLPLKGGSSMDCESLTVGIAK